MGIHKIALRETLFFYTAVPKFYQTSNYPYFSLPGNDAVHDTCLAPVNVPALLISYRA